MKIVTKRGKRVVRRKRKAIRSTCDFRARSNFRTTRVLRRKKGKLTFVFTYTGNGELRSAKAKRVVKFGK